MSEPGCSANQQLNPITHYESPAPTTPVVDLQPQNQPPPVQTTVNLSDPSNQTCAGGPPQNNSPNPLPQSEYPAPAPQVNLPPPVLTVMVQSDPAVEAVYQVPTYKGYPVQNYLPNAILQSGGPPSSPPPAGLQSQNQPPPIQTVVNQSDPSNQIQACADSQVQNYLPNVVPQSEGPPSSPPPSGLQSQNQPPPVQTVVTQSGLIPAPHQVQTCAGGPPQNNSPNPLPQSEYPAPAPQVNQSPPVQTVMFQSAPACQVVYQLHASKGYPVQNYLPNAILQSGGPPSSPPPAGLQSQNQPPPVQTVVNQSDPNPAPHQGQTCAGYPIQNYLPNSMPQQGQYIAGYPMGSNGTHGAAPPPAGLQPNNQPPPVQTVVNHSGASDSASHQVQSYAGPPVQNYLPNAMPQSEGPPSSPPPAGLQSQNQPPPVQTVVTQSGPAQQQDQACAEGPPSSPPPPELQTQAQPPPVQTVVNPSGPGSPAQVQPYAAPPAPPLIVPYGVPPGLEYLTQIDQILIHQKIECIELLTGFETNNQYEIKNSIGQEIYHAKENSNCLIRNLFGSARNFEMQITDNMGQEVMRMQRPMRCLLQEIEIQAPPGIIIGYVKQEWSCFLPKFSIRGLRDETLLKIHGPFLPIKCCGDINFEVKGLIGGISVGKIIKQRSGFLKKCFTDASNFCIQFPLDMDVNMKAVLLGACFLIDIMFFDKGGNLFLKLLR